MEAVLLAVTLLSLAIALGASSLAWRVMRNERLRSEARIAALAADLGIEDDERPLHASRRAEPAEAVEIRTADEPIAAPAGMFAPKVRERSAFRFAAGIGVASLLVAAVIGTLVLTSRGTPHTPAETGTGCRGACVCARGRAARTDRSWSRARGRSSDGARRRARRRTGARAGSAYRRGVAVRSRGNAHRQRARHRSGRGGGSGGRAHLRRDRQLGGQRRPVSHKLQKRRPHRAACRPASSAGDAELGRGNREVSSLRVMSCAQVHQSTPSRPSSSPPPRCRVRAAAG